MNMDLAKSQIKQSFIVSGKILHKSLQNLMVIMNLDIEYLWIYRIDFESCRGEI